MSHLFASFCKFFVKALTSFYFLWTDLKQEYNKTFLGIPSTHPPMMILKLPKTYVIKKRISTILITNPTVGNSVTMRT